MRAVGHAASQQAKVRQQFSNDLGSMASIPTLFIIDERGKIIYGDVSLDASKSSSRKCSASLTKQRQVPRMARRNEFEMRLGGSDECEHQSA